MLRTNQVELLADVRTAPGSRRMPHFGRTSLERELPAWGIAYRHLPGLGGLRKPLPGSLNQAWRHTGFRGYADYMQTPEFEAELRALVELAGGRRVALMCVEAVPWRCHRTLLADALSARGVEVHHITGRGQPPAHRLTDFAVVTNGRVSYPGPATLGL